MSVAQDMRAIQTASRFEVLTCIDGYEVISADTGRPVAKYNTPQGAHGMCAKYNRLATAGAGRLATAWRGTA